MDQSQAPRLAALLTALRRRLVGLIWLHGVGSIFLVASLWLGFAFLADWWLHVPRAVRLFHGFLLLLLPGWIAVRELLRRVLQLPDAAGLAILAERTQACPQELLVSAVQLAPRLKSPNLPEHDLIRATLARAETQASAIDLSSVLDARRPLRRLGSGLGALTAIVLLFGSSGELASIFFQRMLGRDVAWPQRTHLKLEIPSVGDQVQVEAGNESIAVRLARGSDLAVVVRAEGVIPEEVELHFAGGNSLLLSSGGSGVFRTRLRALQEPTRFWVTGGDDQSGLPIVDVAVLEPPDVVGVAVTVVPPSYTGLASLTYFDRDVDVLAGSELSIHVLPDPPSARGAVRLLPDDRTLELTASAFPVRPEAPTTTSLEGLGFQMLASESFRYRFELTDDSGLANPDPGLFGVQVSEDRRPELVLVAPARAEVHAVAGAVLALRVRASDDFGIASLRWSLSTPETELRLAEGELERVPLAAAEGAPLVFGRVRLELATVVAGTPPAEGSQWVLQAEASDNCQPQAQRVQSPPIRLRIVSSDEYMRRLQDDLARVGEQVRRVLDLIEEKARRLVELESALGGEASGELTAGEMEALLTGARRVQGDARALGRELAGVCESFIYARLDERAGPLLEAVDQRLANVTDKAFDAEPWRELAQRYAAGEFGSAELAAELLTMVGLALSASEEHAAASTRALELVRESRASAQGQGSLGLALERLEMAKGKLEELAGRLAEWDNFQSVLSNLRDILNGQKNLLERTRQYEKEN